MALTKRSVVYILIPLILVGCVTVLAVVTWRTSTRYRVTLTLEDRIPSKAHIADLIFITKSNDLLQATGQVLSREMMMGTSEDRMSAIYPIYTVELKQIGSTNRLTLQVISENEEQGKRAIEAFSRVLIEQYGRITEASKPVLRVAGEPTISRIHQRPSVVQIIAPCTPFG